MIRQLLLLLLLLLFFDLHLRYPESASLLLLFMYLAIHKGQQS